MLGQQIIPDESGKIVGVRIVEDEGINKMELTFQSSGTILGVGFNNTGTIVASPAAPGALYSEGRGIVMTQDGEMASWTFQGIARPKGPGIAGTFRGSVFFRTQSAKLAPLTSMCVVVAAEVDENQNMTAKLWEWA